MSHDLKSLLELAQKAGIELHPDLSPLQDNGCCRMLAGSDLPANTVLFRQTAASRLQPSTQVQFPGRVDSGIQLLHRLASEADTPQSAGTELLLSALHAPELTRTYSAFYLSEADIKTLASLHDVLPAAVHLQKNRVSQIVQYLSKVDPALDPSRLENLALNAFRLNWFSNQFTPLTHLFRSCGLRGASMVREGDHFLIRTSRPLQKGEEIFLSMGRPDIFDSIVSAPGFEADLRYYIAFGARVPQRIASPMAVRIVQHVSQSFPIALSEKQDVSQLQDPSALLMESGPSASLIAFCSAMSMTSPEAMAQQKADQMSLKNFLEGSLTRLQAMNHVRRNGALITAPSLQKYVQAAQRDLEILTVFENWITDSAPT